MNYQEAICYIESLERFGIKLGLVRIERLLDLLDHPETKYRTIHVTGTNGKGSTSAMISAILTRSGCRTGLYVSPHLETYRERMQIDRNNISEEDFAAYLMQVKQAVDKMVSDGEECPTQFEVLTALAFLYFAGKKVEYAVIEVGLGGLLDSTNVITPEVSVITNVTMEHADRCGGTLEGIAHHKAGIIKDGIPVVTAAKGLPLEIIRQMAEEKNTDVFVLGEDFNSEFVKLYGYMQELRFSAPTVEVNKTDYGVQLLGLNQLENSALAIMAAGLLHNNDKRITMEIICQALCMVNWPGRFERMDIGETKIVIDGAHNPAGAKSLKESLDFYYPDKERVFLLGILKDKDCDSIINNLLRYEDVVVVTAPISDRAEIPSVLAQKIHVHQIFIEEDYMSAVKKALSLAGKDKMLCITGSLYLIGAVRKILLAEKEKVER